MIKKITVAAIALALSLSVAMPAFATNKGVKIDNDAYVNNNVNTSANTGNNKIKGWGSKGVKNSNIQTGDAFSSSTVLNGVNSNIVDTCGCNGKKVSIDNDAHVTNNVNTSSNTGYNEIKGGKVKNSWISTGGADSGALVGNVVNTNVVNGTPD